jgi:hypothetical protein
VPVPELCPWDESERAKLRQTRPRKSKPALFSLYFASLSFTGAVTEENPLVVASEDGKYTPEMRALQATRGFGPQGANVIYQEAFLRPTQPQLEICRARFSFPVNRNIHLRQK